MIQVPAINTLWTTPWHLWHFVTAALAGGTASTYVTKAIATMPPLPANANYWQRWAYAFLQAIGGVKPGIAASWDGHSDRREPAK